MKTGQHNYFNTITVLLGVSAEYVQMVYKLDEQVVVTTLRRQRVAIVGDMRKRLPITGGAAPPTGW